MTDKNSSAIEELSSSIHTSMYLGVEGSEKGEGDIERGMEGKRQGEE